MRNRWFGNLVLIVISAVVGLLICEGGIRLWVMSFAPNLMILDDELGWTHRRNAQRTYHVEGVEAVVDMNELGLRGALYTGVSQRSRVLILGDSFADGLEVSNEELFSVIWDRERSELEVVNAGVGGYGTLQALLRLQRLEPLVQPDFCVLMVFDNDLRDNIMPFYPTIGARPYVDEQGEVKPIRWELFEPLLLPIPGAVWLHRHSLLAYLFRNRFWFEVREKPLQAYIEKWRQNISDEQRWSLLEDLVKKIASHKPLVLVALPRRHHLESGDHAFAQRLQGVAQRMGVDFVNLYEVLKPEHFYEVNIHWNAAGHRVVAEHLAAVIQPPVSKPSK